MNNSLLVRKTLFSFLLMTVAHSLPAASDADVESQIADYEKADRITPPPTARVVLVGGASLHAWTSLETDFPRVDTLDRTLLGGVLGDYVRNFDRVIRPVRARVLLVHAESAELNSGRTPEEYAADFHAFCELVHAAFPIGKVIYLSAPLTPADWSAREKIALTNVLVAAQCAADPRRVYLDTNAITLGVDGRPRVEFFAADGRRVNDLARKGWAAQLLPIVGWGSTRFEKDILAFEDADRAKMPPLGGVLFTGDSFVRFWDSLAQDFPGVPITNRGFGGAFMMDAVYYFNRLVPPSRPRLVVLNAGGNDIVFGHRTGEEIAADFRIFRLKLHAMFPETKLIYLSIARSPLWARYKDAIDRVNPLLAAECSADPLCTYVDVSNGMMTADGEPREELFRADRLHLNADGYTQRAKLLKPLIK